MSLWAVKYGSFSNGVKNLEKLTKTFDEGSVTWNSPWKVKGGDYSGVAGSNSNGSVNKWEEFDVTNTIRNIIEEGGDNNGFIVKMKTATSGVSYFSSENSDTEHRPKLEITYYTYETNPPEVSITSPNGGELYTSFEIKEITWEAFDNDGIKSQELYITPDNGGTWMEFADIDKDQRSYEFEVPFFITDQYKAKIVAYDESGNYSSDLSDDFFTVKPDTINPSENFVNFGNWNPLCDELGSSYEYGEGAKDSISMKYKKVPKQTTSDPWITLNAILPSGKNLYGVRWIKVSYKADFDMLLALYNQNLAMSGTNFNTDLPPTSSDGWETAFFYVGEEVFRQPDWVSNKVDLDLSAMTGLAFEADMGYGGAEAHLQIREVIFYNYDNTPISLKSGSSKSSLISINKVNKHDIEIAGIEKGNCSMALYNMNGRKLFSTSWNALNTTKIVNNITGSLSKGNYLIQIMNNGKESIKSIPIK